MSKTIGIGNFEAKSGPKPIGISAPKKAPKVEPMIAKVKMIKK